MNHKKALLIDFSNFRKDYNSLFANDLLEIHKLIGEYKLKVAKKSTFFEFSEVQKQNFFNDLLISIIKKKSGLGTSKIEELVFTIRDLEIVDDVGSENNNLENYADEALAIINVYQKPILENFFSQDFLLNLHQEVFKNTLKKNAGKYREDKVYIQVTSRFENPFSLSFVSVNEIK